MTPIEFVEAIHDVFCANGWTKSQMYVNDPVPAVELSTYSAKCNIAKVERAVCLFVRDNNIDPSRVRFSCDRGLIVVQLRNDLIDTLAIRPSWKRLPSKKS